MEKPEKNIFALWDRSTGETRIALQTLAEGFNLGFMDPDMRGGDSLEELVHRIWLADRVLVVHPPDDALVAVAFETGVAIGLGKRIAILELSTPGPLAYGINVLFGSALPEDSIAPDLVKLRERLGQPSYWFEIPLEDRPGQAAPLLLCPREGIGIELRGVLANLRPDWVQPVPEDEPRAMALLAATAGRLLWVLVPNANPQRPWANVLAAISAGVFYGASFRRSRLGPEEDLGDLASHRLELLRESKAPRIQSLEHLCSTFNELGQIKTVLSKRTRSREWPPQLTVQRIEIRNFKNIEQLDLDLTLPSSLPGNWSCIAGINGSGKTAILQALTLALLGPGLAREIGGQQLLRMLRRTERKTFDTEIRARVLIGDREATFSLELDEERIHLEQPLRGSAPLDRTSEMVFVAYGSSRNLSTYREDRYDNLTPRARRQMTLFDPRARITSVEILLDGGQTDNPALVTFRWIVEAILGDELKPPPGTAVDRLVFGQSGTAVEAIDLPDGFRSTVAWLADLCVAWHEVSGKTAPTYPADIRAIVLIDEIDLHLHPSLQRALVPRLRKVLSNVQFIVTTHSPLVLASFDRNEIVALDRTAEGGVRELDRQIFGFSADEIYQWLMDTSPKGTVIEQKLRDRDDPDLALYFYQSAERNEEEARADLVERRRLIEKFLGPQHR